jgi:hypothetical protein
VRGHGCALQSRGTVRSLVTIAVAPARTNRREPVGWLQLLSAINRPTFAPALLRACRSRRPIEEPIRASCATLGQFLSPVYVSKTSLF